MESKIDLGNSIVFLWKKKVDVTEANYSHIEKDMKTIFENAKILKKEDEI